jgi:glutaredoxin
MKLTAKKFIKNTIGSVLIVVFGIVLGKATLLAYHHIIDVPLVQQRNFQKYYVGENSPVMLLGASWCQFCKKTRALFEKQKVKFTDYDVEKNELAKAIFDELNGKGFPVILIGSTRINGYDEQAIIKALKNI